VAGRRHTRVPHKSHGPTSGAMPPRVHIAPVLCSDIVGGSWRSWYQITEACLASRHEAVRTNVTGCEGASGGDPAKSGPMQAWVGASARQPTANDVELAKHTGSAYCNSDSDSSLPRHSVSIDNDVQMFQRYCCLCEKLAPFVDIRVEATAFAGTETGGERRAETDRLAEHTAKGAADTQGGRPRISTHSCLRASMTVNDGCSEAHLVAPTEERAALTSDRDLPLLSTGRGPASSMKSTQRDDSLLLTA